MQNNGGPQAKTDKEGVHDDKMNMSNYSRSSTNRVADKRASAVLANKIYNKFSDVLSGTGCFEGTFILQVKEGSKPYEAAPRRVACALQEPVKKELDRLQRQQVIVPLAVDKTSGWCNSFTLVPRANGKIRLYLGIVLCMAVPCVSKF